MQIAALQSRILTLEVENTAMYQQGLALNSEVDGISNHVDRIRELYIRRMGFCHDQRLLRVILMAWVRYAIPRSWVRYVSQGIGESADGYDGHDGHDGHDGYDSYSSFIARNAPSSAPIAAPTAAPTAASHPILSHPDGLTRQSGWDGAAEREAGVEEASILAAAEAAEADEAVQVEEVAEVEEVADMAQSMTMDGFWEGEAGGGVGLDEVGWSVAATQAEVAAAEAVVREVEGAVERAVRLQSQRRLLGSAP
uniref:Uncharacterized protein n=1 Tax=Haptolina ericina TaxID=156174 RepID=A0A7S3AVV0_9EUKA